MSTWFITRHPGARQWAHEQGLDIDRYASHLDPAQVAAGDTVIGSLGLALAARLNMYQAMQLANAAAGVVVGKLGTAVCTHTELFTLADD